MSEQEPQVHTVTLPLCDLCLDGKGGECHVPGCALWMKSAPDVPIRDRAVFTEDIHVEYAARFGDGYIGPEQDSIQGVHAYLRHCRDVADVRDGVDAIVMRSLITSATEWEKVPDE